MRVSTNTKSFTKDEVLQARNVDLLSFLKSYLSLDFAVLGKSYRCKQHQSLTIKGDCKTWYWHSRDVGGYGSIDFLMKTENQDFSQAIETLIGEKTPQQVITKKEIKVQLKPQCLQLPKASEKNNRVYAYLTQTRGISKEIVKDMLDAKYIYQDDYGNAVFVGYDEKHQAKYASLRSTSQTSKFKLDCTGSDKHHAFKIVGNSDKVYVFESAIDALSHATLAQMYDLDYKKDSRVSLGGVSQAPLEEFLAKNENIKTIVVCLDSDERGTIHSQKIKENFTEKGYEVIRKSPKSKDFNEDLQNLKSKDTMPKAIVSNCKKKTNYQYNDAR
ncbi:MAG: DUF3991 and TOPRIM domain-containing protein [Clostridia bacterium]